VYTIKSGDFWSTASAIFNFYFSIFNENFKFQILNFKITSVMLLKIVFVIAAIFGIIAIFYVSWFWRALIAPMIILFLADVVGSLFRKKSSK